MVSLKQYSFVNIIESFWLVIEDQTKYRYINEYLGVVSHLCVSHLFHVLEDILVSLRKGQQQKKGSVTQAAIVATIRAGSGSRNDFFIFFPKIKVKKMSLFKRECGGRI